MIKISLIGVSITLCLFFFSSGLLAETTVSDKVSAQSVRSLSSPEWQRMVDGLQAQTKSMLEENDKLSAEYSLLQEKLSGLQDSLKSLRDEVAKQEAENRYWKQKQQVAAEAGSGPGIQQAEKELSALQAKNEAFKKELASLQERNSVWESQILSLNAKKRELLLDQKLQAISREEVNKSADPDLTALARQLAEAQIKSDDLNKTLQDMNTQQQALPQEIEKLKADNKVLASQAANFEQQLQKQEQENKKIEKDNRSLSANAQPVPADLAKQKRALEQELVKLDSQFDGLRQSVDEAKAVLDRKRQVMDEIMKLDGENQEIRGRINTLMQEIAELKGQAAPAAH